MKRAEAPSTAALTRRILAGEDRGCCPHFHPEGWDGVTLHLRDLPVLRATTRSLAHEPLNMGRVMTRGLARERGHEPGRVFIFYTTCPKCARAYGRNPVVGFVELT